MTDEIDYEGYDGPDYLPPGEIDEMSLYRALTSLYILGEDMFMGMQAYNLCMVDNFITGLEYQNLQELFAEDRTPASTHFLSAQSQMWIFAAYELLRIWQERSKNIVKWSANGGLEQKLTALKAKDDGIPHSGRDSQIKQIESVIADPSLVNRITAELKHLHAPFTHLEFIRVAIAKHQIRGKAKSAAHMPGYGRINKWCGSLDYQMEIGRVILGNINRRDIADSLRSIDCAAEPPSDENLKSFDDFMRGEE